MERRYAGTALGRQELLGEIVDEQSGSLWRRDWIERQRVKECPELRASSSPSIRPVTATANSDACGIIVAGLGADGRAYIAADRSLQGREPHVWARAAVRALSGVHGRSRRRPRSTRAATLSIAILRQIDEAVAVRSVRATRGKWLRAEPVAALYAEGPRRARGPAHDAGGTDARLRRRRTWRADSSPDRVDALVLGPDRLDDRPRRPRRPSGSFSPGRQWARGR